VNKGIQTQTAECLVVGELTANNLIVVLNKIDVIPSKLREVVVSNMQKRLSKAIKTTRFGDCKMVPVAACPGGADKMDVYGSPLGIDILVANLMALVSSAQKRLQGGDFLLAADHCFPVKGHGTVLTGTVLKGQCRVGDIVELPHLKLQKKVRSLQVFKRPVQTCAVGDRVGMCITQFDSKLFERGIVAAPGTVPSFIAAVVSAEKIRFFKGIVHSKMRYHVTVGYTTVMATAVFFKAPGHPASLATSAKSCEEGILFGSQDDSPLQADCTNDVDISLNRESNISAFNEDLEYEYSSCLDSVPGDNSCTAGVEHFCELRVEDKRCHRVITSTCSTWALLRFDRPVTCPAGSKYVASRFDADIHKNSCRLAFHGRIIHPSVEDPASVKHIKVFTMKKRFGSVDRVHDVKTVIGKGMFKKETDMTIFQGLRVFTSRGEIGTIAGAFGKSGKFKVCLKDGVSPSDLKGNASRLILNYKHFLFGKEAGKQMKQ
jgi:selenocysteine-specific elongation factor